MTLKTRYAHESNYTKGRTKPIQYIVIHYTANDGDTAEGNANYFSQPNRNASAHYFTDETGIVQTVKDTDTAWHCGTSGTYYHVSCRNNNSIGVELCSRKNKQAGKSQYYFKEETKNNAIELVQFLMKKYNVPISNIVRHYDVTHKLCPEPFVNVPEDWERFKQKIEGGEKMTVEEAKKLIKEKLKFDDTTMQFLDCYKYADALFLRIAENLK